MNVLNITKIEKVCSQLILNEPFYGHFLLSVPKEFTTNVDTAAVSLYGKDLIKLMINDEFWDNIDNEKRYGLIKHEVLHIVLKHLIFSREYNNKILFNIAADIVVNQYVSADQLPEGAITLELFDSLKETHNLEMLPFKGADYYYDFLSKLLTLPAKNSKSLEMLNDILEKGHDQLKKHKEWRNIDQLTSSEIRVLDDYIKSNTKSSFSKIKAKGIGKLPAHLIEEIENLIEEPKFNWKRLLRIFASSSSSTYLKNTIRRKSKRFGIVPGIKLNKRQDITVIIDTSGSVTNDLFTEFFNEIYYIWRQGAKITILECDVNINKIYKFIGIIPQFVHGRGGTSLDAAVDWCNERRMDGVIYFTDGELANPVNACRYPILFAIASSNEERFNHLNGRKLFLK